MRNLQERNALRELALTTAQTIQVEGFDFEGRTTEGLAFSDGIDTFVVKVIVKKEGFDLVDALDEFSEKETKRLEMEAKKEAQKAKREAKAKAD